MKARALAFTTILLTGIGGTYVAEQPQPQPQQLPAVEKQEVQLPPLERARRAVFNISMPENGGGTAVLVSRTRTANGYKYKAVTAFHVLDDYDDELMKNEELSDKVTLIFQPTFHGDQLILNVKPELMTWALPAYDWAMFTFETEHKLECVEVATQERFEEIVAFETVYIVGCGGPFGQTARTGTIGSTHNIGTHRLLQSSSSMPCNQHPTRFFKLSTPVWYGDSGGAILNQHGELIGLLNGFSTVTRFNEVVTHSGVCLKMHVIRDIILPLEPDFFKVED